MELPETIRQNTARVVFEIDQGDACRSLLALGDGSQGGAKGIVHRLGETSPETLFWREEQFWKRSLRGDFRVQKCQGGSCTDDFRKLLQCARTL